MPEKVTDKVKRLARDLADSVRAELDLRDALNKVVNDNTNLKKHIQCYVFEKEGITSVEEALSFVKGFYEAKNGSNQSQMKLNFVKK